MLLMLTPVKGKYHVSHKGVTLGLPLGGYDV